MLDSILQDENDHTTIQELKPGDSHINLAGKIHTNTGSTITQKFTEEVGATKEEIEIWKEEEEKGAITKGQKEEKEKKFVVEHNLKDNVVQVSALKLPGYAPITLASWSLINENSITIAFTVAPGEKGALVVVIG